MRFLLVVPKFAAGPGRYYDFPLGISYVSSALKQAGHEVHCLNLNHVDGAPGDAVARAVADCDPEVCGTGGLSPHFHQADDILAAARKAKPSVVTLLGGGLISADPTGVGPLLDADVGVLGEGEETVVELARVLAEGGDLAGVRGIGYRGGDGWEVTPARDSIADLDSLAWPDFEGFEVEKLLENQFVTDHWMLQTREDPRCLPMVSSRRCPFACTFCYHPMGRGYRERGLDDFFAELDHLVGRYAINQVAILDELFSLKKDRLREFCERIKPYGLHWMAQFHVSVIDADTVAMMKDAGCVYASYGLESMSDVVLDSMKKKTKRADVDRALETTWEHRVGIQGNFIFGDPAETRDTANETMAWWAANRRYHVSLGRIQVYPGSDLYERALADGIGPGRQEMIRGRNLVNFMGLDHAAFLALMRRLEVFSRSLLEPAEVLSFEAEPEEHPRRGPLFAIRWRCPRCGEENHYRHAPLDDAAQYQAILVTCRSCLSRFDVANAARTPWSVPELDAQYARARALRDAGRVNDAVAVYRTLVEIEFPLGQANRPEAVIRAFLDLGEIFLASGLDPRAAVGFLGEAVTRRVFDPATHALYATALAAEGSAGAARLHLDQARRLAAPGDAAVAERLDALEAVVREAEARFGPRTYLP